MLVVGGQGDYSAHQSPSLSIKTARVHEAYHAKCIYTLWNIAQLYNVVHDCTGLFPWENLYHLIKWPAWYGANTLFLNRSHANLSFCVCAWQMHFSGFISTILFFFETRVKKNNRFEFLKMHLSRRAPTILMEVVDLQYENLIRSMIWTYYTTRRCRIFWMVRIFCQRYVLYTSA